MPVAAHSQPAYIPPSNAIEDAIDTRMVLRPHNATAQTFHNKKEIREAHVRPPGVNQKPNQMPELKQSPLSRTASLCPVQRARSPLLNNRVRLPTRRYALPEGNLTHHAPTGPRGPAGHN